MPLVLSGTNGISTNGSTTAITVDTSGRITYPNQTRFLVNRSGSQTGFDGSTYTTVVLWNNAIYNIGNNFNTTTGLFTAPVTGFYGFAFSVYSADSTSQDQTWWVINGARGRSPALTAAIGSGTQSGGGFDVIRLIAGDTVGIHPYMGNASGKTITDNYEHTWWRGVFLG